MTALSPLPVERARLLAHLKALEGERHPWRSRPRLEAAQQYVLDQWRAWSLDVRQDEFSCRGASFVNLIASLPTPSSPAAGPYPRGRSTGPADAPRLIIGAHVDTVSGTPGADDNASGVAVLLELSRIFASAPPGVPLELIVFNLEEQGMLGSTHYAQTLRRAGAAVLGMFSLEMVGFTETEGLQHYPWFLRGRYPAQGTYLALAANRRSRRLLTSVAAAMRTVPGLPVETMVVPADGWLFPESRLSDHSPFWDAGFPALLLTDTSFFRNPHYHGPSDTVETLDLSFLEHVTQGLVAVVRALGPRERR